MNTFREIEGLSNENLASGVLRLLLLRSVLVREKLVSLISRHSPVGPVASFSHFSCYTEYPTKDEDHGGGRIDLVLELDDAVVGIESKFFAGFQANQPEKYARSIEALANTLSRARDREPRSFVVVLVPQSLRHTAMGVVQPLERAAVLTWDEVESVLQDLLERSATLSPDDAFLVREFASYLKGKLSLLADYDAWGSASSSFVRERELRDEGRNPAELVVATTYPVDLPAGSCEKVELANEEFFGPEVQQYAWLVNFDETWSSLDRWAEVLAPFTLAGAP